MLKWINKKRNKKGFTLVELVVVIAILGILAAIAIPRFTKVTANAQKKSFEANHRIVQSAIQLYLANNNGAKPAADYAFTDEIEGGISGLQNKPITGCTYVWNGTKLISTPHADLGGSVLEYTP